jgi:hypothetical protein
MGLSLIIFFFLPYFINIIEWMEIEKENFNFNELYLSLFKPFFFIKNPEFRFLYVFICWFFVFDFFYLIYYGAHPVEIPYIYLSQCYTIFYFLLLIVFIPVSYYLERKFFKFINSENKNQIIWLKFYI